MSTAKSDDFRSYLYQTAMARRQSQGVVLYRSRAQSKKLHPNLNSNEGVFRNRGEAVVDHIVGPNMCVQGHCRWSILHLKLTSISRSDATHPEVHTSNLWRVLMGFVSAYLSSVNQQFSGRHFSGDILCVVCKAMVKKRADRVQKKPAGKKPAGKKPSARKPAAKKPTAKKRRVCFALPQEDGALQKVRRGTQGTRFAASVQRLTDLLRTGEGSNVAILEMFIGRDSSLKYDTGYSGGDVVGEWKAALDLCRRRTSIRAGGGELMVYVHDYAAEDISRVVADACFLRYASEDIAAAPASSDVTAATDDANTVVRIIDKFVLAKGLAPIDMVELLRLLAMF